MNYGNNWTFDSDVIAKHFDAHVREQLPWYEMATGAIAHIVRHYLPEEGLIYDIGASTGNIGRSIQDILQDRKASLIAIESSEPMAKAYAAPGQIINASATEYDFLDYDVAVAFLVFMFIPVAKRKALLQNLCNKIKPGGALVIVDKEAIKGGYFSTIMHRLTIAGKVATGCKADDIIRKELSLSGVQRPIDDRFVERHSPIRPFEFFRFGEFAGWIIENPE